MTDGNWDIKIDINQNDKTMKFHKKEINSKIYIFDSLLEDWNIEFIDLSKNKENIIRRDQNGLTGCLNIYDSQIENLTISIDKAKCEDGINFVRTNGSINRLLINNSSFDGIDSDFSNLEIRNVKITDSGNDCMDFSYGFYHLDNLDLTKYKDKAISIGRFWVGNRYFYYKIL